MQLVHKKYHNECHVLDKDTRKQMVYNKVINVSAKTNKLNAGNVL